MTLLALLLVSLGTAQIGAQATSGGEAEDRVESTIDWETGTMRIRIERSVAATAGAGPTAVSQTQRAIRRDATGIVVDALARVPVDSYHTVDSLAREDESVVSRLTDAARAAVAVDATATADLKTAGVTFSLDLYRDLGSRLVEHDRAVEIDPLLGWVATTEYTGILIYAADELPLFGTQTIATAEPALFPGIYYAADGEDLIYRLTEVEQIAPQVLANDGPVGYTSDHSAAGHADRLGTRPLRILAIGTFGRRPIDLVISERDARRILGSRANIELFTQGRVVVVLAPDRL